jgi:hypothetical protein
VRRIKGDSGERRWIPKEEQRKLMHGMRKGREQNRYGRDRDGSLSRKREG